MRRQRLPLAPMSHTCAQTSTRRNTTGKNTPAINAWLVTMAIFLVSASAVNAQSKADKAPQPPNIVFIMADDLGYGHLGCYGQQKIHTPNIDRLATQGMRFTQAYSGSHVCAPARSVLMTGLHAGHTPIRANGGGRFYYDTDITVAEVLKQAGYATGMFGKWGGGIENTAGHPNRQGFDEFFGQMHQVHANTVRHGV